MSDEPRPSEIRVGSRVRKRGGTRSGTVRSIFSISDGMIRYAVEWDPETGQTFSQIPVENVSLCVLEISP